MSNFKFDQMDMGESDIDSYLSGPTSEDVTVHLGHSLLGKLRISTVTDFDLQNMQLGGASLEPAFERTQRSVTAAMKSRTKVASVGQLSPFMRISSDTLVHKSNRDLWALRKEGDGNFYIERLFDDNGTPLKG
jgi:hypothetical protein